MIAPHAALRSKSSPRRALPARAPRCGSVALYCGRVRHALTVSARMQAEPFAFGIGEERDVADVLRQLDDRAIDLAAGLLDARERRVDGWLRAEIDEHTVAVWCHRRAVDDRAARSR